MTAFLTTPRLIGCFLVETRGHNWTSWLPHWTDQDHLLGLQRTVEEQCRVTIEVRRIMEQRQANKDRHRTLQNSKVTRTSPGAKVQVGDRVLV